jgi:hypothetical protein
MGGKTVRLTLRRDFPFFRFLWFVVNLWLSLPGLPPSSTDARTE